METGTRPRREASTHSRSDSLSASMQCRSCRSILEGRSHPSGERLPLSRGECCSCRVPRTRNPGERSGEPTSDRRTRKARSSDTLRETLLRKIDQVVVNLSDTEREALNLTNGLAYRYTYTP